MGMEGFVGVTMVAIAGFALAIALAGFTSISIGEGARDALID